MTVRAECSTGRLCGYAERHTGRVDGRERLGRRRHCLVLVDGWHIGEGASGAPGAATSGVAVGHGCCGEVEIAYCGVYDRVRSRGIELSSNVVLEKFQQYKTWY